MKISKCLTLIGLALVGCMSFGSGGQAFGQTSATHSEVFLTGQGDDGAGAAGSIQDWNIFPFGQTGVVNGALGFSTTNSSFTQFNIAEDAAEGGVTAAKNGLGIGFGPLLSGTSSDSRLAQVPLHVVGGGDDDAFGAARVIIEDRTSTATSHSLLTLTSKGGSFLDIKSTQPDEEASYSLQTGFGRFDLVDSLSGSVGLRLRRGPKQELSVSGNGVAIGRINSEATSMLEVFSNGSLGDSSTITSRVVAPAATRSRTMLNLVNNGAPSMTFTDSSIGSTWFFSNTNDELNLRKGGTGLNPGFIVEADGEFRFVRDNVAEAPRLKIDVSGNLLIPGQVITVSDRGQKENIESVDTLAVLEKVCGMPISTWNYKKDDKKVPHMGPMAQDFNAAFDLGDQTKMIGEMDKSGVTLAAVQGLNQKLEATANALNQKVASQQDLIESKSATIADLSEKVDSQTALIEDQFSMIQELQARMEQLEASVAAQQN